MIKKIGVVAILLAAGVGIAMYLRGGGTASDKPPQVFTPRTGVSDAERIADLEKALAAQVDRNNLQDSSIRELQSRLGSAGGNRRTGDANNVERDQRAADLRRQFTDANGNFDPAKMRERQREQQLDRLVQAGFTRERAEWLERRTQELQVQAMQAQEDARRNGQQYRGTDLEAALRKEIGDSEYEKYLTGTNRPTKVEVRDVFASSAAEKSGIKPGDQITSYAGQRVFDTGDLNALTRQGNPGEVVSVEVQRDGQTVQLQVPRGVLGIQGAGGGRGGGFPGGGARPGGFGGGRPAGGGRPGGG